MTPIILGAGISGLGASYSLRKKGFNPVNIEKDDTYGGLCGNFTIQGFRFDRFVHFSFAKDEEINAIFNAGSPEVYRHIPNAFNLYHGTWLKHPAQNNLFPLSESEKSKIIADFKARPAEVDINKIQNYEQWLRLQYGNYFAEHFPMVYTKKYWMADAKELETKWVGNRLYQPSIEEVEQGARTADTPVTYYAKEMRYPKQGGFKQYLSAMAKDADIRYNQKVDRIVLTYPYLTITTCEGKTYTTDQLISSLPLPEVIKMLGDVVPEDVRSAADKLRCTSGYQISLGLKTKNIPPYLWWYIYDEDILPARVYSPSLKSPDNAPEGCSSLQMEVYCEEGKYSKEELIAKSVIPLYKQGIIKQEDVLFIDVRFERYANVIFDYNIYEARKTVREYLSSIGIETIGRFGEWDYLWSDQSLISGLNLNRNGH